MQFVMGFYATVVGWVRSNTEESCYGVGQVSVKAVSKLACSTSLRVILVF